MGLDTTALQNAILNDFFGQVDLAANLSIGTTLYLSLHTADPGENGTQQTHELGASPYTQCARQPIARNTVSGWTPDFVIDSKMQNTGQITFPQRATAGGTDPVATWWGLGTSVSGAGLLLKRGPLIASGAVWLYGSSRNSVAADTVEVSGFHAGSQTFTDGDEYVFAPLYKDIFPTAATSLTARYKIKAGSLPGAASPYSSANNTVMKFVDQATGAVTLDFTSDGSFQLIKAAPITITNGSFPVFNNLSLSIFQS